MIMQAVGGGSEQLRKSRTNCGFCREKNFVFERYYLNTTESVSFNSLSHTIGVKMMNLLTYTFDVEVVGGEGGV